MVDVADFIPKYIAFKQEELERLEFDFAQAAWSFEGAELQATVIATAEREIVFLTDLLTNHESIQDD